MEADKVCWKMFAMLFVWCYENVKLHVGFWKYRGFASCAGWWSSMLFSCWSSRWAIRVPKTYNILLNI